MLAPACLPKKPAEAREPRPGSGTPRVPKEEPAPEPPPPQPRLLPDPGAEGAEEKIQKMLARTDELLGVLADRTLSDSQREELDAGAAFLAQAREALRSEDSDRALVLAEKALALIENLEEATRP
jgi:hypothetical protein